MGTILKGGTERKVTRDQEETTGKVATGSSSKEDKISGREANPPHTSRTSRTTDLLPVDS